MLVKGEQRGSGVLLGHGAGGTWLVTNHHVIDGLDQVCVRTADGRLWLGTPVLPASSGLLDLAFVWLPASGSVLPLANVEVSSPIESRTGPAWGFPIVQASGFTVPDGLQAGPPRYQELAGLLLPLLSRPLEGGLQLASTSPVRKGMSGGGLFDDQDRLIGLNTTHADPLWSSPLREEGGKVLSPHLNRQLELVALAIPVSRILPLLREALPPAGIAQTRVRAQPICSGVLW